MYLLYVWLNNVTMNACFEKNTKTIWIKTEEAKKLSENFDFNLKRDRRKKNSHERRGYESVDDNSLLLVISQKHMKKRI